jgi:hypothetical protein
MYGIYTFGTCQGLIATRNRIGGFMPYYPGNISTQLGMYLTATATADTHLIANNFIYLNSTAVPDNNNIYGIGVGAPPNTNHDIFYNSIYIGGSASSGLSAGIARNRATLNIKNNIVFNDRTGGTGATYCVYDSTGAGPWASNYNDLYVLTPGESSQYVYYRAGVNFDSLANWYNTTGHDSASISVNPDFASFTDLHINPASISVNNLGTPITRIIDDYDGDVRSITTPDIGADEYTPGVGYEEPSNENLTNNPRKVYPNPFKKHTLINYHLNKPSIVQMQIYNCLGIEVRTLINRHQIAGTYSVNWDGKDDKGRNVGTGLYILRLYTDMGINHYRLLLIK